ncbi:hypothetical protein MRB56_19965 [Halomonas cupida]|uniref:hypothetical protein n=1 Tax=Halomonas cupida TaxID=44933 RepID=UPI0039B4768A
MSRLGEGGAAVGHQADARPHHTSRSAHLRRCGADENQIDQDELFDCHVDKSGCWSQLWCTSCLNRQTRSD